MGCCRLPTAPGGRESPEADSCGTAVPRGPITASEASLGPRLSSGSPLSLIPREKSTQRNKWASEGVLPALVALLQQQRMGDRDLFETEEHSKVVASQV